MYAQENVFSLSMGVGTSLSQIKGDSLEGYHHLGLRMNAEVMAELSPKWKTSVQLGYRQSGSADQFYVAKSEGEVDNRYIDLDYGEIGLMLQYIEWKDDVREKLKFMLGLKYGRLLSASKSNRFLGIQPDSFDDNLYSLLFAVDFAIGKTQSIRMGYERSVNRLYQSDDLGLIPFSIFASLQFRIL